MPEARAAKKIFKWNPLTTRPRARPKYRWEDNIIQDLGQMQIKNWLTCVQDRAKWKDVVEKAKTSNWRRFSAWRRRRRRRRSLCKLCTENGYILFQNVKKTHFLLNPVPGKTWGDVRPPHHLCFNCRQQQNTENKVTIKVILRLLDKWTIVCICWHLATCIPIHK